MKFVSHIDLAILISLIAVSFTAAEMLREILRSRRETIKEYFLLGNEKEMIKDRFIIRCNTRGFEEYKNDIEFMMSISNVIEFYELWGRMVAMHYLPLKVFEGASCVSICTLFDILEEYIKSRRETNVCFAQNYENLCNKLKAKFNI